MPNAYRVSWSPWVSETVGPESTVVIVADTLRAALAAFARKYGDESSVSGIERIGTNVFVVAGPPAAPPAVAAGGGEAVIDREAFFRP